MAKFFGIIGYTITEEKSPGVWVDKVYERSYTGDVIRATRRWNSTENVNPNLTISDTISIVADEFTLANMHAMKYVKWRGATWAIDSVTIERPRMTLAIGGLYSGNTTPTPD